MKIDEQVDHELDAIRRSSKLAQVRGPFFPLFRHSDLASDATERPIGNWTRLISAFGSFKLFVELNGILSLPTRSHSRHWSATGLFHFRLSEHTDGNKLRFPRNVVSMF